MPARPLADWLENIESLHPRKWDLGLDRVKTVAERMDLLHPEGIVFLVAGTNGKGSTCEYIDRFCRDTGLVVGKSTSPHLLSFNERIQINGSPALDEEICAAFEIINSIRGDISLTYFEFSNPGIPVPVQAATGRRYCPGNRSWWQTGRNEYHRSGRIGGHSDCA